MKFAVIVILEGLMFLLARFLIDSLQQMGSRFILAAIVLAFFIRRMARYTWPERFP